MTIMSLEQAKQQAKSIVNQATEANNQREELIRSIAKRLELSFADATTLVKGEEARKEAAKRYRESDAYKQRLENQKVVRMMMKN